MWAVYRKEMRAYLLSPMAWVLWCFFLVLFGFAFNYLYGRYADSAFTNPEANLTEVLLGGTFGFFKFLFLFIVPLLSMRLFAEEKEKGTLELLFTYPLTEAQLLFGKVLAAISMVVVLLALPLVQFAYLGKHTTLEWSVVWTTYLGLFLLLLAFISLGIFASAIANSQFVALVVSVGVLLLLWLANVFSTLFSSLIEQKLPFYFKPLQWLASGYKELSLTDHFESFSRGLINSNDVLFYLSFAAFFLYLTYVKLESRKWRG